MKKFRFRLEKVLWVKEIKEKVKMKEVATINRKIQYLNKELQEYNIRAADVTDKISKQRQGITNSTDLKRSLAYAEILKKRSVTTEVNIKLAMHEIDKKREELMKINSEKNVIQKLKEQKLEEFNKEMIAREQLENDEISQRKSRIVFPPAQTKEEKIAGVRTIYKRYG